MLNQIDRNMDSFSFEELREKYNEVLHSLQQEAANWGLEEYIQRAIMWRLVGAGCTYYQQPYDVLKPIVVKQRSYAALDIHEDTGSRLSWCRYLIRVGYKLEAIDEITQIEVLLPILGEEMQKGIKDILTDLKRHIDAT